MVWHQIKSRTVASRKYYGVVCSPMVYLGTAKLAGIVMAIGMVAMAGTNLAFAQQPSCGEQPYVYNVGCLPLDTAHMVGAVMVAGIAAFAIAWGVAGRHNHIIHNN